MWRLPQHPAPLVSGACVWGRLTFPRHAWALNGMGREPQLCVVSRLIVGGGGRLTELTGQSWAGVHIGRQEVEEKRQEGRKERKRKRGDIEQLTADFWS